MTHKPISEERSCNHFCRGKGISISYSECVLVALVIQHAVRMRLLYCHLWPLWLYHIFSHYLIKQHDFKGKKLLNIKYVFSFSLQNLSEKFLILRRIQTDIVINIHRSSCKVPVILVRC